MTTTDLTRLERATWVLIYAGLLGLVLGLFAQRSQPVLGWSFVIGGGLAAVLGVLLIFVRSRMRETP